MFGKGRKERSDKKTRVNAGLSQSDHKKLERLAFAVAMPKTILAAELISLCLNNPNIVTYVQKKFEADPQRRVIPVVDNGEVTY